MESKENQACNDKKRSMQFVDNLLVLKEATMPSSSRFGKLFLGPSQKLLERPGTRFVQLTLQPEEHVQQAQYDQMYSNYSIPECTANAA